MQLGDAAEEQTVLRHRVINAGARRESGRCRSRKLEIMMATAIRCAADWAKHLAHDRGANAIFRGILDSALQNGGAVRDRRPAAAR